MNRKTEHQKNIIKIIIIIKIDDGREGGGLEDDWVH